jgi:glycosyltransferase involved in cell wall biosynthesis
MISVVIISKDEPSLSETLNDVSDQLGAPDMGEASEIVVVDASAGRLDHLRRAHADTVRWVDFRQPVGVRVSIPHQRNTGVAAAKGDIIVFTDAGCRPCPGWLDRLVTPLEDGEYVTAGVSLDMAGEVKYHLPPEQGTAQDAGQPGETRYLREAPTLNLAFRREAFDAAGGFDEGFAYGSDVDFTWRLTDLGYRIRCVPEAVLRHDYGAQRRQRRRAYLYGKARAHLYRKHRARWKSILRDDPIAVLYPLFILGLPLTFVFPPYPLLLLIPAWRNRSEGMARVVADHLWFGLGVLAELVSR